MTPVGDVIIFYRVFHANCDKKNRCNLVIMKDRTLYDSLLDSFESAIFSVWRQCTFWAFCLTSNERSKRRQKCQLPQARQRGDAGGKIRHSLNHKKSGLFNIAEASRQLPFVAPLSSNSWTRTLIVMLRHVKLSSGSSGDLLTPAE